MCTYLYPRFISLVKMFFLFICRIRNFLLVAGPLKKSIFLQSIDINYCFVKSYSQVNFTLLFLRRENAEMQKCKNAKNLKFSFIYYFPFFDFSTEFKARHLRNQNRQSLFKRFLYYFIQSSLLLFNTNRFMYTCILNNLQKIFVLLL